MNFQERTQETGFQPLYSQTPSYYHDMAIPWLTYPDDWCEWVRHSKPINYGWLGWSEWARANEN